MTIDIKHFAKVDLRVAEVLSAKAVEESDKLIEVEVSLGNGETRRIFAGMKKHVEPASLVGRKIVICANLAPRKMRFGVSEGMVLAAESADNGLYVLAADQDCPAGAKIS